MKDINSITDAEMKIVTDHGTRADQLRNIRRVMNSSMPPKKLEHFEKDILPGYILRERNARSKAEVVMKKYGMVLKRI